MKRKNIFFVIVIVCFVVVSITCFSSEQTKNDGMVITDLAGDFVKLPAKIQKVVSTSDSCTDMMVAFGVGDKLIGAYHRALENPWFQKFYPKADSLICFDSYQPESEYLISLGTDIIFVPSKERAQALREKGICAITIRYYNQEEMVKSAELLGQIFGEKAQAKADLWIKDFNDAKNLVMKKVPEIEESVKPVAYEILADKGRGPFRTYYGDNQAWLSFAGAILATESYADAISSKMPTEEAILATNPSVIFIGGLYATKEYENLIMNEKWQGISAVKNRAIYIEPTGATAWNSCSTSYPLLVYYCFSKMYPERVDFDLKTMSHDFYFKYYGIDFSSESIELMLQSKAPDGSELWEKLSDV